MEATPRQPRTAMRVIFANNALMTLGFGLWQAVFSNFAVEELGVQADQMGLIQSIREIPGLMGFLAGLLALILAEMQIAGVSVVLMGLGIFVTAATHTTAGLIWATVLMSWGFHFFFSSNSSALLLLVEPKEAPQALGRLNSLGALATVGSTLLILAVLDQLGYRTLFQIAGGAVMLGGVVLLPFSRGQRRTARTRRRTPIRPRYWLYYALEFLMGSRRHIVTTFAVFLLVREYNVTAQTITLLYLVTSLIGTYLHQAFGKLVARFGERRTLIVNFVGVTLIFLSYAFVPTIRALHSPTLQVPGLSFGRWVIFPPFPATPGLLILLAVFILDHTSTGLFIALSSYLQKIVVHPQEITPNISLGMTINHIAAVIMPVAGGLIWEALDPRYTFLLGVGIVLAALVLTLRMHAPQLETTEA